MYIKLNILYSVYIYENIPGGVGLSEKLFNESANVFEAVFEHISRCSCENGCPSCVGPSMEVGEDGKSGAIRLLEFMLNRLMVEA